MANKSQYPDPSSSFLGGTLGDMPGYSDAVNKEGAGPSSEPTAGRPDTVSQDGWIWQKVPIYGGLFKDEIIGYEWSPIGKADDGSGGGAGRNDRLTAAMGALTGYLQASAQADARRMEAFGQFKQLSDFALPAGATTAPGYEPGGSANAFAAGIGLPQYTPPPIKTQEIRPQEIANAAPIPPEVAAMIGAIRGAGG